jgi:hypothetical protein
MFLSGNVESRLRDVAAAMEEKEMKVKKSVERLAFEILCVVVFAALVAGCSQTAAP